MDYYDFILKYKNLKSISQICEQLGINYSNLINNRTTEENKKKVANILKKQIIDIYDLILFEKIIMEYEANEQKANLL